MAVKKKLTPKEKLFVKYYLIDFNASKAARMAGYSEKTAYEIGSQNLKKLHIRNEINKQSKVLIERADMEIARLINELKEIIYQDPSDCFEINEGGGLRLKMFEEMPEGARRTIESIQEDRILKESRDGSQEIIHDKLKIKRASKLKAAELYGKYLQMYKDILELESKGNVTIIWNPVDGRKPVKNNGDGKDKGNGKNGQSG